MYNLKLFTMRKIILLLIVGFAVSFVGCNKLGTDPLTESQFLLNTDVAALQKRITIVNAPLDFVTSTNKSTAVGTYTLTDVWNLAPAATVQSASSVAIDANDVYVGFHVRGGIYSGEIAKITQSDAGTVDAVFALTSSLIDVNDLEVNIADNYLYVAGESKARGGEALKIDLATSGVTEFVGMPIFGASGNSVTRITAGTENFLWVSSGGTTNSKSEGGLIELDLAATTTPDRIDASVVDAYEAKHFDADGDKGLWIHGVGSDTYLYVFENLTSTTESLRRGYTRAITPLNGVAVTDYGKNAVTVDGNFGYVALGYAGAYKVNLAGTLGSIAGHYEYNKNTGRANGIATDGTYVYVAHGADGLIVLDKTTMNEVGRWNGTTTFGTLDHNGSCNYVAVGAVTGAAPNTTTELFVAFGQGGLMKLKFEISGL